MAVIQFVSEAALPGARYVLGLALAALATATTVLGLWRWRQVDHAMRHGTTLPRRPSPAYLATGLCLIGLLVIGAIVFGAVVG